MGFTHNETRKEQCEGSTWRPLMVSSQQALISSQEVYSETTRLTVEEVVAEESDPELGNGGL